MSPVRCSQNNCQMVLSYLHVSLLRLKRMNMQLLLLLLEVLSEFSRNEPGVIRNHSTWVISCRNLQALWHLSTVAMNVTPLAPCLKPQHGCISTSCAFQFEMERSLFVNLLINLVGSSTAKLKSFTWCFLKLDIGCIMALMTTNNTRSALLQCHGRCGLDNGTQSHAMWHHHKIHFSETKDIAIALFHGCDSQACPLIVQNQLAIIRMTPSVLLGVVMCGIVQGLIWQSRLGQLGFNSKQQTEKGYPTRKWKDKGAQNRVITGWTNWVSEGCWAMKNFAQCFARDHCGQSFERWNGWKSKYTQTGPLWEHLNSLMKVLQTETCCFELFSELINMFLGLKHLDFWIEVTGFSCGKGISQWFTWQQLVRVGVVQNKSVKEHQLVCGRSGRYSKFNLSSWGERLEDAVSSPKNNPSGFDPLGVNLTHTRKATISWNELQLFITPWCKMLLRRLVHAYRRQQRRP